MSLCIIIHVYLTIYMTGKISCCFFSSAWTEWTVKNECSEKCGKSGYLEQVRNCTTGRVHDCESIGGRYWKVLTCNNGPCTPGTFAENI